MIKNLSYFLTKKLSKIEAESSPKRVSKSNKERKNKEFSFDSSEDLQDFF
jgi:hypothetical protein